MHKLPKQELDKADSSQEAAELKAVATQVTPAWLTEMMTSYKIEKGAARLVEELMIAPVSILLIDLSREF